MLSKRKINKIKLLNNKKSFRLDKFIELALFTSNGYYLSKKPIGRKFDFVTSPEISQMFGEIIGVYLLYHWREKINSKFDNNTNLSKKASGKTLNNQKFNDIKDQEVRSIFENINKKLYENN